MNATKAELLRQTIQRHTTPMLLEVVTNLELRAPLDDPAAIVYSMACAELCRRLGLNAHKVAKAAGGPAATLRQMANHDV